MARVGIVTCGNCTGELNCLSVSCLRDLRKREGAFECYKDEQNLDLIGIISCAGCPTVGAHEKILKRVRALVEFRVEAIHFTFCMVALCPFGPAETRVGLRGKDFLPANTAALDF